MCACLSKIVILSNYESRMLRLFEEGEKMRQLIKPKKLHVGDTVATISILGGRKCTYTNSATRKSSRLLSVNYK